MIQIRNNDLTEEEAVIVTNLIEVYLENNPGCFFHKQLMEIKRKIQKNEE